ncbi:TPA: hypothetical protein TXJ16_001883 [Streptococcus suis]|nr:hypothetical protein [Streptococcus suis]
MKEFYDNLKKSFSKYNIEFRHVLLWLSIGAIFLPSKFKNLLEVFNLSILKDLKNVAEVFIQIYFDLIVWLFVILMILLILDRISNWIEQKTDYKYSISGENWSFGIAAIRISNILMYLSIDIFVYIVLLMFLVDGSIVFQITDNITINQLSLFQSGIFEFLMVINIIASIVSTFNSIFVLPSIDEEIIPKTYIFEAEYPRYTELRRLNNNQINYVLLKNRNERYYVAKEEVHTVKDSYIPRKKYSYKVLNTTRDFSEAVYSFESNREKS